MTRATGIGNRLPSGPRHKMHPGVHVAIGIITITAEAAAKAVAAVAANALAAAAAAVELEAMRAAAATAEAHADEAAAKASFAAGLAPALGDDSVGVRLGVA